MKKSIIFRLLSLAIVLALSISMLAACTTDKGISNVEYEGDVIYVGNTAGTTGALAAIGVPFNLGIEAAFAAYNAQGGFNGKTVALKHYDDAGDATKSTSLMEKLIEEDEVFAIVGNYGGYAVNVNLDIIKDAKIPMIYAAAGNDALYNANATEDGDKVVFPVQPLYITEGQSLIVRAFANSSYVSELGFTLTGGLGATKVGVIANQDEASQGILAGIKAEAETLHENLKSNIVYQEATGTDFSAQAQAIVAAECDTVIITVTGTNFLAALTALANANFTGNVLTSYNNASAAILNDSTTSLATEIGTQILSQMTIYAQGWLDISSLTYVYTEETPLLAAYQNSIYGAYYAAGVSGFNEAYWEVAENIYDYAASLNDSSIDAWAMSYNAYALAGYIAGDLFCKALAEMEAQELTLTRANLVDVLESKEFALAMADTISYQNGARTGVESFSLAVFYDTYSYGLGYHSANSTTYSGLTSIDELRGHLPY